MKKAAPKKSKKAKPFVGRFPGAPKEPGGTTDTVPAMLTPHEAVLNRNAAELAGRDKIQGLNAKGNALEKKGINLAAMGVDNVPGEEVGRSPLVRMFRDKTQRFQGGASGVQPIGYHSMEETDPGWKDVQLMAPNINLAALKKEAQAQGLSADQVKAIAAQFSGGGGSDQLYGSGGGEISPLTASGGFAKGSENVTDQDPLDMASATGRSEPGLHVDWNKVMNFYPDLYRRAVEHLRAVQSGPDPLAKAPGYQGGISDIGYPPFVAQDMEYNGEEGGWWGDTYNWPEADQIRKYRRGVANII